MRDNNSNILKGKEILLSALNLLNSGEIKFSPKRQSKKQSKKITDIVCRITDKAVAASCLLNYSRDEIVNVLYNYTRGNVHYKIVCEEEFTDDEIINDLANYLAEGAYLDCARKLLNTNRLDGWVCDVDIRLVQNEK